MKTKIILALVATLISSFLFSQNEMDALRYSQINYGGTSRYVAMGGAFGALGGDFSAASKNPAGMGIYRKGEFTCTPSFFYQGTNSLFNGNTLYNYKTSMNVGNIGVVFSHYEPESKIGWKGVTFGFGVNRLNDFNNRISISGINTNNSLLDVYVNDYVNARGDTSKMDAFGTRLASRANLIWQDSLNNVYHHLQTIYGEEQKKEITTSGSMRETVFSLGGNYNDKLYLGMTVGIPHIRYQEQSSYVETADTNSLNGFKSLTLNQDLQTTGTGVNFKFGMIYKPCDWFRFGGAIHSPTYLQMHDEWSSDLTSKFTNNIYSKKVLSPLGSYDYFLSTPMRAITSMGFVINKIALIGIDYEYVDYSSARMRASDYSFAKENSATRMKFTQGNNVSLGAELKLSPLSIRGGIGYQSSPFKNNDSNIGSRITYSAGLGFRADNFFLDLAFVYSTKVENYTFYNSPFSGSSENNFKSSSLMATIGFKF